MRDPRGYIMPSDQPDFPTATKFVNALLKTGVTVHRATAQFTVAGKSYPAGSYVVKSAQAFRPHVLDMFEPQDHPTTFPYPGGPPTRPYDNAGWTLAYQMGVKFDRVLDGFDGPFETAERPAEAGAGQGDGDGDGRLYVRATRSNDAFIAINRLLTAGEDVSLDVVGTAAGHVLRRREGRRPRRPWRKLAADLGVNFEGVAARPAGDAIKLRRCASRSPTSTAARCRRAGRAGCSSSSSSRSRSSIRRRSTPATRRASST